MKKDEESVIIHKDCSSLFSWQIKYCFLVDFTTRAKKSHNLITGYIISNSYIRFLIFY